MKYKAALIVDTYSKKEFLKGALDKDTNAKYLIISIEKYLSNRDVCRKEIFEELGDYKNDIQSCEIIYATSVYYVDNDVAYYRCLMSMGIEEYMSFDYDVENRSDALKESLKLASLVTRSELKMHYANMTVSLFFKCNISKIIQWYVEKEELASTKDIENLSITYPSIIGLKEIVSTEETIESFIPEEFQRVAITYQYKGVQFEAINRKKFKNKDKDELEAFITKVNNKQNSHIVKDYTREDSNLKPPSLITTALLERIGVSKFNYSIDDVLAIADELRSGRIKIHGELVGPLITSTRTSSSKISTDAIESIIEILTARFSSQSIRDNISEYSFGDDDVIKKEAIRPLHFTEEYYPKAIQKYLTEDQFKIYSFIFHRTIAVFLRDAIVNKSKAIVHVEGDEFKAEANKILTDDTGNDYKGWTVLGAYLASTETDILNEDMEIPDSLFPGLEFKRHDVHNEDDNKNGLVLEIKAKPSKEKNPHRYGEGRLKGKLIKDGLLNEMSSSVSIKHMKVQGLAKSANGSLIPTGIGKMIYYILLENAPWMFNEEFIMRYTEFLNAIYEDRSDVESLMEEFYLKEKEFKDSVGYQEKINGIPQDWMVNKALKIAKMQGHELPKSLFEDRKLLNEYINKNDPEREILGKCPTCKDGEIFEKQKSFNCNSTNCNFIVWKDGMTRFLSHFSVHYPEHDLKDIVSIILKNKKCLMDGFINPNDESPKPKPMKSYVGFRFNSQYKKWELGFFGENSKKKKTEEVVTENKQLQKELEDIKEEKRLLEEKTSKDLATRAYNKAKFISDMDDIWINRQNTSIALAFIDADKFKNINDTYGHDCGDEVLVGLSNAMHSELRDKGLKVYRYGGEEFCIIATSDIDNFHKFMENIRMRVERTPIVYNNHTLNVTVSIGIAIGQVYGSWKDLLVEADKMLYKAKEEGRNRIVSNQEPEGTTVNQNTKNDYTNKLDMFLNKKVTLIQTASEDLSANLAHHEDCVYIQDYDVFVSEDIQLITKETQNQAEPTAVLLVESLISIEDTLKGLENLYNTSKQSGRTEMRRYK